MNGTNNRVSVDPLGTEARCAQNLLGMAAAKDKGGRREWE